MQHRVLICLAALGLLGLPIAAAAENSGHANTTAPDKPDGVRRAKAKPVVKRAPPSLPGEPIPYAVYSGTGAPGVTPAAVHPPVPVSLPLSPPPAAMTPPAETLTTMPLRAAPITAAPPLPPPVTVEAAPHAQPLAPQSLAPPSEISLKCDTRTSNGRKLVSSGTFYIDLFPSQVFPDTLASFQFRFVDPGHSSLIRQTMCLDTICSAQVSATAYALVDRVTKKGKALRISLDRTRGAFYAEEIDKHHHLGEQGACVPQPLPAAQF